MKSKIKAPVKRAIVNKVVFKLGKLSIPVLLIEDIAVYDDNKLTTKLEKQLDAKIADYLGFDKLIGVAVL